MNERTPPMCARKIGFEIEDGSWYTWKTTECDPWGKRYFKTMADSSGVRPMAKHEILHDGIGVRMEADTFDEDGMRLSDVEFVTDPVPLCSQGHAEAVRAMHQIERIYTTISRLRGRDHVEGEFVGPEEHHLSQRDVLLSRGGSGESGTQVRVQATHGLSLADIPRVYEALGAATTFPFDTGGDAGMPAWHALESLRSAPERALKLSLAYIDRTIGRDPALHDPAPLLGFLTTVIAFLRGMHTGTIRGGIKTQLPVMHRNDFATMFNLLPPSQRQMLRANQTQFIGAVLAGVFGDPERGIDGVDLAAHADQPVVKSIALTAHRSVGCRTPSFWPKPVPKS